MAFIDFKKAFDSVDRQKLCLKLSQVGIQGKLLKTIQSMYLNVKSCIGLNSDLSEYFCNKIGLMQGEVLSPILFNLYVNDFESLAVIHMNCQHSVFFCLCMPMIWFYSQNPSESIEGLHSLLNELSNYCEAWKLSINVEKAKVLVFRKGGKSKPVEILHIGEHVLEIVDQFTYLGIIFITIINLPKQKSSCLNKVGKHCLHLKEISEICV